LGATQSAGAFPSHAARKVLTLDSDENSMPMRRGRMEFLSRLNAPSRVSPVTHSRGRLSPNPTAPVSVEHLRNKLSDALLATAAWRNACRNGKSTLISSNLVILGITYVPIMFEISLQH